MYEHLSKRAECILKLADQAAREYDQDYVGTEHVLLAIAREGTGLGAKILENHGITEDRIKAEIDQRLKASMEDTWVFGRLPGSPHFRNVVATAIKSLSQNLLDCR